MKDLYIIELSRFNMFGLSAGVLMLVLVIYSWQRHLKRKYWREFGDLKMEIRDLKDQRTILADKNAKLQSSIGSLSDLLKKSKKR